MSGQKSYFGKQDIRPSFLSPQKPTAAKPKDQSLNYVKSLENNPSAIEEAEKPSFFYTASIAHGETSRRQQSSKKRKSRLLKSAPLIILAIILASGVALILGATSFLGPHLSALFTEATNTDYTAYNLRSNEIFTEILQGKQPLPSQLKARLEKQNITVKSPTEWEYNGTIVTAENYEAMYNGDVFFREAIDDARRGRAATFFDDTANTFYQRLGLSRDVLHDYKTTGNNTEDTARYDDLMTNYYNVNAGDHIGTVSRDYRRDDDGNILYDDAGNPLYDYFDNGTVSTSSIPAITGATSTSTGPNTVSAAGEDPKSAARARAKAYLDSVGNKVEATTPACAALEIGNMIATAIASNAKYTYANSYMTTMENISKTMAGNGDASATNSVLNWFTRTDTATVYDTATGEEIQVTGSPLEAQSVRSVLNGTPIDQTKTRKYSLERGFDSTNISIANAGLTTTICTAERAAGVVISLSALAIPGSHLITSTIGLLLHATVGTGVRIVASSILGLLVPTIAEVMFENAYTNAVGIAGGEEFGMGAANINQLAAQQNSGLTGGSKSAILVYNQANNLTIAQQAEIDRKNHSPLDVSNKNTFLGSITHSFLPLATTSNTLFSPLSTLTSTTSTSIASLNPTYAASENSSYLTNFGNYCDKITEIGATGNVFCDMVAVSDLSTINLAEDDSTYRAIIAQSVDVVDGKEVVRDNSPLANYINFWMGRYSMPGIYDANIAHACEKQIAGRVPIISDLLTMVQSISGDYCKRIADGSRYINSEANPDWATEKYHQLWAISTRVKDNLGFYEDGENPLTAYRNHYEASHPFDNSRSGYLARISGLTKADSELVLALSDYYRTVANYNPKLAYNFISGAATFKQHNHFSPDNASSPKTYNVLKFDGYTEKADYIASPRKEYLIG